MRWLSWRSTGPASPAVWEFWLSPTGAPFSRVKAAASAVRTVTAAMSAARPLSMIRDFIEFSCLTANLDDIMP